MKSYFQKLILLAIIPFLLGGTLKATKEDDVDTFEFDSEKFVLVYKDNKAPPKEVVSRLQENGHTCTSKSCTIPFGILSHVNFKTSEKIEIGLRKTQLFEIQFDFSDPLKNAAELSTLAKDLYANHVSIDFGLTMKLSGRDGFFAEHNEFGWIFGLNYKIGLNKDQKAELESMKDELKKTVGFEDSKFENLAFEELNLDEFTAIQAGLRDEKSLPNIVGILNDLNQRPPRLTVLNGSEQNVKSFQDYFEKYKVRGILHTSRLTSLECEEVEDKYHVDGKKPYNLKFTFNPHYDMNRTLVIEVLLDVHEALFLKNLIIMEKKPSPKTVQSFVPQKQSTKPIDNVGRWGQYENILMREQKGQGGNYRLNALRKNRL
jgi:hypothetical protein